MNIYKIEYGWFPSSPEASIVIAENEDEAVKLIDPDSKLKIVDDVSDTEDSSKISIKEIEISKGVVYTGHFCC